MNQQTHWITEAALQQIVNIRYGQAKCLPVEFPQGYREKLKEFSFDWSQFKRVIEDEAAHFAVRVSPTYLRIFTRSCSFGIDLSVPYAQVSLDETIWMTELVTLHQRNKESQEKCREVEEMWREAQQRADYWENCFEAKDAKVEQLEAELKNAKQQLKASRAKNVRLLSRSMKLVRKFGKGKSQKSDA